MGEHLGFMKTVALVLLLIASPAIAEPTIELVPTCVEIDVTRDQLPEAERPAARLLLVRALERLDQLIVETGCKETITLSHVHDTGSIDVRIASSQQRRKLTVSIKADMLEVYGRIGKALLEPPPPPPTIDDAPVETPAITASEPEEPLLVSPSTWYAMMGLGIHDGDGGKGFSLGFRYGANHWKGDVAMSVTTGGGSTTTSFRAQALRLGTPHAWSSAYYGMGLSYATTEVTMSSGVSDSSGMRIESTIGAELGRSGGSRIYLEGNLSIPLYDVADSYPVAFVASLGAGF